MSGAPPQLTSSAGRIPVVIAMGDFASGVTSWAFRLRAVMAGHPRFKLILMNCASTKNRIGEFDCEATTFAEVHEFLDGLGPCIVIPNFVFDVYRVCVELIQNGRDIRCVGFCRADSDDEYYNPLAFYEPVVSTFAAVSPQCALRLGERLPERQNDIFLMPTGVSVPSVLDRPYETRPIRLIYGGRIAQLQKRVMDFIPLVENLLARRVDFRFDVVGGGRELPRLQEAMSEVDHRGRVNFLGRVSPEEMTEIWRTHDVFIQTSDFEGTSNSMLESMAQGAIPVVTHTESGVEGIIDQGVNGFTAPIGDMAAMAAHVEFLANSDRAHLARIGDAAWVCAGTYSIEAYAEKFTAMLEATLQAQPPHWPERRPARPEFDFHGIALDDPTGSGGGEELLQNATFELWGEGGPDGWICSRGAIENAGGGASDASVTMIPNRGASNVYLQQQFSLENVEEPCTIHVTLRAKASEPHVFGFNLYVKEGEGERAFSKNHPGDGKYHTLSHRVYVSKESLEHPLRFFVVLRKGASQPAEVACASASIVRSSRNDDVRFTLPQPVILPKKKGMKRLLIAFPSPLRGGAEDYTVTIARAAVESGWDVHTAFSHRKATETLIRDFTELGAQYHRLEVADIFASDTHGGLARRVARTLRMLRRLKPDAVLVELCGIQYGLGLLIGCAIAGVPTQAVFQMVRENAAISLEGRVARMLTRWRRQNYIAVSESNREILAERFKMRKDSIKLVPNGASVERFSFTAEQRKAIRARVRDAMGVSRHTKLLITVGRLAPQKGHDILVPAIPHIVHAFPNVLFIWAGEGPLQERLQESAAEYGVADHVRFLGRRNDVPELLAASDLFVHPTRFEGQPFSLLEAIAAELPIVTTVASGIREVVEHKRHALLCEVEDIRDLREWVLYALQHPDEMRTLATNALRERLPEYSESLMVQRTLELFESSLR